MTELKPHGRHRADAKPVTPLTGLTSLVGDKAGGVSRKSAVALASTGLIFGMGVPQAVANGGAASTEMQPLTAAASPGVRATSIMTTPADAEWAAPVEQLEITVPDNPDLDAKPKPKPQRVVTQEVSRSADRTVAAEAASIPSGIDGSAALEIGSRYVGTPYVYGGSTPGVGMDCSGFVSYVYAQLGISLPHGSTKIHNIGTVVSADEVRPGDIVWTPGHVALYVSPGEILDATPSRGVTFRHDYSSSVVYLRF